MTVRQGRGHATTCELYAKIIAESELLQPALNEIHKFCFQHWSRGRGTCGTGSGAPGHSSPCPTALTSSSRSVHLRSGMGYKVGVNQLKHLEVVWLSGYIFSPHFAVQMACLHECRLLLISFHDNKLFSFTELGNIVVMSMLPWVDEKFTVKFTLSNVDGIQYRLP